VAASAWHAHDAAPPDRTNPTHRRRRLNLTRRRRRPRL